MRRILMMFSVLIVCYSAIADGGAMQVVQRVARYVKSLGGYEVNFILTSGEYAAKGYFYIWDMSQEFYVTSDGVATTNQLTLVETTKVRLNAVNMTDRDAYTRHAVGREIFDYSVEIPRDSSAANKGQSVVANEVNGAGHMGDLGNIVLADDASVVQTFTLTFEGSHNYVASVFSDRYYYGANNKLNIKEREMLPSHWALHLQTAALR